MWRFRNIQGIFDCIWGKGIDVTSGISVIVAVPSDEVDDLEGELGNDWLAESIAGSPDDSSGASLVSGAGGAISGFDWIELGGTVSLLDFLPTCAECEINVWGNT